MLNAKSKEMQNARGERSVWSCEIREIFWEKGEKEEFLEKKVVSS